MQPEEEERGAGGGVRRGARGGTFGCYGFASGGGRRKWLEPGGCCGSGWGGGAAAAAAGSRRDGTGREEMPLPPQAGARRKAPLPLLADAADRQERRGRAEAGRGLAGGPRGEEGERLARGGGCCGGGNLLGVWECGAGGGGVPGGLVAAGTRVHVEGDTGLNGPLGGGGGGGWVHVA